MARVSRAFVAAAAALGLLGAAVIVNAPNSDDHKARTSLIAKGVDSLALEETQQEADRLAAIEAQRIAAEKAVAEQRAIEAAKRERLAAAARQKARASRGPRVQTAPAVHEHAGSLPPIMLKIRWCESRNNYTAQNRSSTASGAWQFLDSSWAKYAGYPRAYMAPPHIQDQKALNVYNAVGTRPWNASRSCWG